MFSCLDHSENLSLITVAGRWKIQLSAMVLYFIHEQALPTHCVDWFGGGGTLLMTASYILSSGNLSSAWNQNNRWVGCSLTSPLITTNSCLDDEQRWIPTILGIRRLKTHYKFIHSMKYMGHMFSLVRP